MTKKTTAPAFRSWLSRQPPTRLFDVGMCGCPLSVWKRLQMNTERLDKMPRWCSRFAGAWDATALDQSARTANAARQILDVVT